MMVVGEPGIGKTALCEQLSTYVTLRSGRSLLGHCYEEGSLSLPYLAFVEALRSYVLSREINELEKELGTGASDVARIVSEVRERMKIELRPQKDPEEERYRLLKAVTTFPGQCIRCPASAARSGRPARCRQRHARHADAYFPPPRRNAAPDYRDVS
jgi:hypothetical protein